MKLWALLFFVLVSCGLVYADEPPYWPEFEVKSTNGAYLAKIINKTKSENRPACFGNFKIVVLEIKGNRQREIWSCDYSHLGYPGGILSDDGSTFVYCEEWYFDGYNVFIYRNGKNIGKLLGKDFKIAEAKLKPTVSHQLWLIGYRFKYQAGSPLLLEIDTIDGNKHLINAKTGEFVKESAAKK